MHRASRHAHFGSSPRSPGATAMIRRAFTMRLKPDSLAEYKQHHDNIWPELVAEIERSGIASITTFQRGLDLFLVSNIADEAAWSRLWNSPVHKRWAEVMEPLMHLDDSGIVDAGELTEIFHLAIGSNGQAPRADPVEWSAEPSHAPAELMEEPAGWSHSIAPPIVEAAADIVILAEVDTVDEIDLMQAADNPAGAAVEPPAVPEETPRAPVESAGRAAGPSQEGTQGQEARDQEIGRQKEAGHQEEELPARRRRSAQRPSDRRCASRPIAARIPAVKRKSPRRKTKRAKPRKAAKTKKRAARKHR